MIETIRNAWKIPELRKKILFTVFALLIFRLGSVVPVPFIDSNMLGATLNNMGGIFTLLGAMNGTAFSMAAVFALGVQPYINSSIIIQLLTVAIPALERLQKEGGEEGRKKIAAITRYVTVAIGSAAGLRLLHPDPHPGRRNDAGHRRPAWLVGGYRHRTVLHCRLRLCHVAG